MKIQIRRGVFETNSSSMHSIVILKNPPHKPKNNEQDFYLSESGTLKIWDYNLEFGRTGDKLFLNTPYDKFLYLCASYAYDKKDKIDEFINIFKSIYPNVKKIEFPDGYGYVDHESMGLLQNFLEKNKILPEEFLKNDKIKVCIDGDEYGFIWNVLDSGIASELNIDKIIMTYDEYYFDGQEMIHVDKEEENLDEDIDDDYPGPVEVNPKENR